MKIAMTHVNLPNESKGGVAFQVHYLANALTERGHDVTMFTFSPAWEECRYRVHRLALAPSLRRVFSFVLAAHLARTDFGAFDVVHTNGDNFLMRPNRFPQVRTFYGSARDEATHAVRLRRRLYQNVLAGLERRGVRLADISVGISEATRARVPGLSHVVPCGVDVARFRPGTKAERPVLLFVGTAGGRKRGTLLAETFAREIRPRFADAELWTVADQPLAGNGVTNFGKVPLETLADLYRRAWVFCLPSTYEGFGVPYIEALASGTAVVATPNAGAREVLGEGAWGVLANDQGLGQAINRLFADATARTGLARRGREHALNFAWERIAQRYERLYAQAAAAAAAHRRRQPHTAPISPAVRPPRP